MYWLQRRLMDVEFGVHPALNVVKIVLPGEASLLASFRQPVWYLDRFFWLRESSINLMVMFVDVELGEFAAARRAKREPVGNLSLELFQRKDYFDAFGRV